MLEFAVVKGEYRFEDEDRLGSILIMYFLFMGLSL